MERIKCGSPHFDADPDPSYHFDADPDPCFQTKPQYHEKVLKLAHIPYHTILACHLQTDADLDPDPAYPFDEDPDPDPQH
jgi:hypothetical protein